MNQEEAEKEEVKQKLLAALAECPNKPKVEDGWLVMNDPGESFGGIWRVGVVTATFKEFCDFFQVKPWVLGAKNAGADKGKVALQFGAKDPKGNEWIFSANFRFANVDDQQDAAMVWEVKSTLDVIEVGQFLADRFGRPGSVKAVLDDGTVSRAEVTFYNKTPE